MSNQLPEVVQALLNPAIYPDKTTGVELIQTQMSFVFLTGEYVYKTKKPVNLGYLDYTTLEKRHFFCEQEVRLNRRLCPEPYLGVIPVTRGKFGITLAGQGEVVEYAVKMRYLPQERLLNVLLDKEQVSADMVEAIAQKLVEFHAEAETNPAISAFGSIQGFKVTTDENFYQTQKYCGTTITPERFQRIKDYTNNTYQQKTALFNERVTKGRIRDCHGDLHAQHICFCEGVCIFDCIEFNDRFRYCDVASEIAFLAMDLDHYGRADLSRSFINAYVKMSGDSRIPELLKFYKCYRAYVRGKVDSFKYDDPYISSKEREPARDSAWSYFELAESYTRPKPLLLITVGLAGSGKTTLSRALSKRLGLTILSSDIVRKQLASVPVNEHRFEEMDSGIYSPEFSRRTYDTLFSTARSVLEQCYPVILDASFIRAEDRRQARALAEETGADYFVIECSLDPDTTRQRLNQRLNERSVSDGRWEIYQAQKLKFDPVTEVPGNRHFVVHTAEPLESQLSQIIHRLYSTDSP